MRKPSLSANVVKGLFEVIAQTEAVATDCPENKYFAQACEYLDLLIEWYQSKHPDFDVLDVPDWEAGTDDEDYDMVPDDDFTSGEQT